MQHADQNWFVAVLEGLFVFFIMFAILWAKAGKQFYIRKIAGLTAIDEAVGRALEMGRPILMVPGIGGLGVISIQALQIFAYITKTAARYGNPIRLCCIDALVYAMAQEIVQDAYRSEDKLASYDPDSVRCIPAQQFAFAAGVAGMIQRERVAASFLLGDWFAESLIFAESGNIVGAIQVAGSTQTTQTPFFIASCDYVIIGDEFYAGSAFLSREPVLMGSIVGQDLTKGLILASILVGVVTTSIFVPSWVGRRFVNAETYISARTAELHAKGQPAVVVRGPTEGGENRVYKYDLPDGTSVTDPVRAESVGIVVPAMAGRRYATVKEYVTERAGELHAVGQPSFQPVLTPGGQEQRNYTFALPDGKTMTDTVNVETGQTVLIKAADKHNYFKELYSTGGWDTLLEGLGIKKKDTKAPGGGKK